MYWLDCIFYFLGSIFIIFDGQGKNLVKIVKYYFWWLEKPTENNNITIKIIKILFLFIFGGFF
jgi:hypothetical protein